MKKFILLISAIIIFGGVGFVYAFDPLSYTVNSYEPNTLPENYEVINSDTFNVTTIIPWVGWFQSACNGEVCVYQQIQILPGSGPGICTTPATISGEGIVYNSTLGSLVDSASVVHWVASETNSVDSNGCLITPWDLATASESFSITSSVTPDPIEVALNSSITSIYDRIWYFITENLVLLISIAVILPFVFYGIRAIRKAVGR